MADFFTSINWVTIAILFIFAIPILAGFIRPFSSGGVHRSFSSLINMLIILASVVLSVFLAKAILGGSENFVLSTLIKVFPALEHAVAAKETWVYPVFISALFLIVGGILRLLTIPVYTYIIVPLSNKISEKVNTLSVFPRRTIAGIWQAPRAAGYVLIFCALLTLYTGFFNTSFITEDASNSEPYQFVQGSVIRPLMNTGTGKDIQVILDESFALNGGDSEDNTGRLILYFNGVTLEEAILSNPEIDSMASTIVGTETDDKQKAYLIYQWICDNIDYDNEKAEQITSNSSGISSGAAVAYATRKGICFDFSCLYVAMCRAAELRVRFIVGSGFSGTAWGDHAWNQVYCPDESRWIDVDTSFGSTGANYFDRPYFYLDHKDGAIQGEW